MTNETVQVVDDAEAEQYLGLVGGEPLARLDYRERDGVRTLLHTEVVPRARGRGLAAAFVGQVLEMIRHEPRRVAVVCPYVKQFLARHPEYRDVVR